MEIYRCINCKKKCSYPENTLNDFPKCNKCRKQDALGRKDE